MLSWVTKMAPANRKGEYLGFFAMINSTLWSFGPVPGGVFQSAYGSPGLFIFAIGATLVSVLMVYFLYSKSHRQTMVSTEREFIQ